MTREGRSGNPKRLKLGIPTTQLAGIYTDIYFRGGKAMTRWQVACTIRSSFASLPRSQTLVDLGGMETKMPDDDYTRLRNYTTISGEDKREEIR